MACVDPNDNQTTFEFDRKRYDPKEHEWDTELLDFLNLVQMAVGKPISMRTEHKRSGFIFRGHPCYRGAKNIWQDWARFDWGEGYGKLPGEIWCFLDLADLPNNAQVPIDNGEYHVGAGVYAVIESSYIEALEEENDEEEVCRSQLFEPILKEMESCVAPLSRKFYLASVEAIIEPLCVVPDIGSVHLNRYFVVSPRRQWAEHFKNWLRQPHIHDQVVLDDQA